MRRFFDTNVLVYRFDRSDPVKHAIAVRQVDAAVADGSFIVSTQVLQEFVHVAQRKYAAVITPELLRELLSTWIEAGVIAVDDRILLDALTLQRRYSLSWWDALIVGAAERSGARVLYSEDLQHGLTIGSLRIENPFANAVHEPQANYG